LEVAATYSSVVLLELNGQTMSPRGQAPPSVQ